MRRRLRRCGNTPGVQQCLLQRHKRSQQLVALSRRESDPFQRVQMLCKQPGKRHNMSELFASSLARVWTRSALRTNTGGAGKAVSRVGIAAE